MFDSPDPLQGNRFAVLGEHGEADEGRPRRRLVLVSQQAHHGVDHEGESDTESLGGASVVEDVGEVVEPTVVEIPVSMEARVRAPARAFASFDAVNLTDLFESRAKVMRSDGLPGDSRGDGGQQ